MRFLTIATLTTLACGLAFAAQGSQPVTYVSGNLDGLVPNSGATVDIVGMVGIRLESGKQRVNIPFAGITRAELSEVTTLTDESPLYKVWKLPKRFLGRRAVQQLSIDYKGAGGQSHTLTIEASQLVAEEIVSAIEFRTEQSGLYGWWGDRMWKTSRNQDQWDGKSTPSGPVASREEE